MAEDSDNTQKFTSFKTRSNEWKTVCICSLRIILENVQNHVEIMPCFYLRYRGFI